jgi:hypothetical protein
VADGSCAALTPGEEAAVSIEYEAGWRPESVRAFCRRGEGYFLRSGGGKPSASPLPTITEDVQHVYIPL